MENPNPIQSSFFELLKRIRQKFKDRFNLSDGIDKEGTIIYIKREKRLRGANVWLLICSIMIATLGLDLNSPAIIIGAMLISPLMAPILGIGLAIGTNDKETLFISVKNFFVAIGIALLFSTTYFYINPLGHNEATGEMMARTAPTLLDGMVAIFGGIAGIISSSRGDNSNAIPGVAIATALMPPLCVSGYGLANGNLEFFLNAFYLFFLNSFFIAMSTWIFIRYMNFPIKGFQNPKEFRRNATMITVAAMLIILPSIKILYNVISERENEKYLSGFIHQKFNNNALTKCINYDVRSLNENTDLLELRLFGKDIPFDTITKWNQEIRGNNGRKMVIRALQEETIDKETFQNVQSELFAHKEAISKLQLFQQDYKAMKEDLAIKTSKNDSLLAKFDVPINEINQKLMPWVDDIEKLGYAPSFIPNKGGVLNEMAILIFWKEGAKVKKREDIKSNLRKSLKAELKRDDFYFIDMN